MREYVSDIAFTNSVKKIQEQKGSRSIYINVEQRGSWNNTVTEELRDFIAERDSFYMSTVNSEELVRRVILSFSCCLAEMPILEEVREDKLSMSPTSDVLVPRSSKDVGIIF